MPWDPLLSCPLSRAFPDAPAGAVLPDAAWSALKRVANDEAGVGVDGVGDVDSEFAAELVPKPDLDADMGREAMEASDEV